MSSADGDRGRGLVLGSSDGQHLIIRPQQLNAEGWVRTNVDVRIGGFSGHVEGDLRIEELSRLRSDLRILHDRLAGEVVFSTMEDWIEIRFVGNRHGHIDVDAQLRDCPGTGNTLRFSMSNIDQTHLPEFISAIDSTLASLTAQPEEEDRKP